MGQHKLDPSVINMLLLHPEVMDNDDNSESDEDSSALQTIGDSNSSSSDSSLDEETLKDIIPQEETPEMQSPPDAILQTNVVPEVAVTNERSVCAPADNCEAICQPDCEAVLTTEKKPLKKELYSANVNSAQTKTNNSQNPVKPADSITVLTWNIWFEEKWLKERTLRIIGIIKDLSPDLVALQEVVAASLALLKAHLPQYHLFQVFVEEGAAYGDAILCKRATVDVVEPYYYDYPETQMGRRLIGCEISMKTGQREKMHFLTTHLESMWTNAEARNLQFGVIQSIIAEHKNVILCGDFNIANNGEAVERTIAGTDLKDAWTEIGCPSAIKWTYNGEMNKNINGKYKARYDRIYYRFRFKSKLDNLKLVGLGATNSQVLTPPSDHFGLLAQFY